MQDYSVGKELKDFLFQLMDGERYRIKEYHLKNRHFIGKSIYGPKCDKTCLWGFRQSETQTSLLSYRDKLENQNFTCSKYRYDTFQKVNNKGVDQSAQMHRLVCTFVKTGFLASRTIW